MDLIATLYLHVLVIDFLIQYSANGTWLTSVSMQEYVTSVWLL